MKKLPPGHVLTYRRGQLTLTPYWEISFLQPASVGEAKLVQQLKAHLIDAIYSQLAEGKVTAQIGTCLSGGVDSSTVTGILTQLLGCMHEMRLADNRVRLLMIGESPAYPELRRYVTAHGLESAWYFPVLSSVTILPPISRRWISPCNPGPLNMPVQ